MKVVIRGGSPHTAEARSRLCPKHKGNTLWLIYKCQSRDPWQPWTVLASGKGKL